MFKWFTQRNDSANKMLEVLQPGGIGVLSAACCYAGAKALDDTLVADLKAAGVSADEIKMENITTAQQALPLMMVKLNASQRTLVQTITGLFMRNGLSVFPMLIVNGEIAFYGGSPGKEALAQKLNRGGQNAAQ
jgi:hypothetical protein